MKKDQSLVPKDFKGMIIVEQFSEMLEAITQHPNSIVVIEDLDTVLEQKG